MRKINIFAHKAQSPNPSGAFGQNHSPEWYIKSPIIQERLFILLRDILIIVVLLARGEVRKYHLEVSKEDHYHEIARVVVQNVGANNQSGWLKIWNNVPDELDVGSRNNLNDVSDFIAFYFEVYGIYSFRVRRT